MSFLGCLWFNFQASRIFEQYEPSHAKTCFLHMRKHRHRSAAQKAQRQIFLRQGSYSSFEKGDETMDEEAFSMQYEANL